LRLWAGTLVANLIGGWVMVGLMMMGLPEVRETALRVGTHAASAGFGREAFASAMIGGAVITLMTWMERSTDSVPGKLVAAEATGFLLAAATLQHAIVVSLEMFAALQVGADFGYAHWLACFGWAATGNIVGGVGLVTVLRLVQVGPDSIQEERRAAEKGEEPVAAPSNRGAVPDGEMRSTAR
jgi:formate/nitrite transporter FocA (FNT family)